MYIFDRNMCNSVIVHEKDEFVNGGVVLFSVYMACFPHTSISS